MSLSKDDVRHIAGLAKLRFADAELDDFAAKLGDIDIRFTHDVKFDRLAPPLETAVFRIVQECLTNARRHSQSDKVHVELAQTNGQIKLRVEDWGTGFLPDSVAQNCFGLEGVQERTRLFGGKINIDSAPGKGTRISVELPVVEA